MLEPNAPTSAFNEETLLGWNLAHPAGRARTFRRNNPEFSVAGRTVYVMDNHRAAWWCWLRHFNAGEPFNLFHIDRHTDTLTSNLSLWLQHLPAQMRGVPLHRYLGFQAVVNGVQCPVIRWDNYLSLFLAQEQHALRSLYMATHHDGDDPNVPKGSWRDVDVHDLPENFGYSLEHGEKWIVNIDLDYFFCTMPDGVNRRFLSEEFVRSICDALRNHLDTGRIKVLTICLTPDDGGFCGGWAEAEALCAEICGHLNVAFRLP